jgi:hypothetical protein
LFGAFHPVNSTFAFVFLLRPFVVPGQRSPERTFRGVWNDFSRDLFNIRRTSALMASSAKTMMHRRRFSRSATAARMRRVMLKWLQAQQRIVFQAWSKFARRGPSLGASGVLLHDPAASSPHDLDDPFFDPAVQSRVATMIAGAAQKKANEQD